MSFKQALKHFDRLDWLMLIISLILLLLAMYFMALSSNHPVIQTDCSISNFNKLLTIFKGISK